MSKLYFKYGVMGSSKTANALMTRFNYEERGKYAWLIKPAIDTRDDTVDENGRRVSIIKSRIGLSAPVDIIAPDDNISKVFEYINTNVNPIDAIIVDEAQFLTRDQINSLREICTNGTPVLCYGLRTDFKTNMFPGSQRLMEVADIIEQIKHVCRCGKAAQVNAKILNGTIVTEGEQIDIGGNEKYEAMCWKCYNELKNKSVE